MEQSDSKSVCVWIDRLFRGQRATWFTQTWQYVVLCQGRITVMNGHRAPGNRISSKNENPSQLKEEMLTVHFNLPSLLLSSYLLPSKNSHSFPVNQPMLAKTQCGYHFPWEVIPHSPHTHSWIRYTSLMFPWDPWPSASPLDLCFSICACSTLMNHEVEIEVKTNALKKMK